MSQNVIPTYSIVRTSAGLGQIPGQVDGTDVHHLNCGKNLYKPRIQSFPNNRRDALAQYTYRKLKERVSGLVPARGVDIRLTTHLRFSLSVKSLNAVSTSRCSVCPLAIISATTFSFFLFSQMKTYLKATNRASSRQLATNRDPIPS